MISDLILILGFGLILYGAWLLSPPLSYMIAGGILVLLATRVRR